MPPWKQTAADESEKRRQAERKESLQKRAKEAFKASDPISTQCAVSVHYSRKKGRSDSANIIGGILDSLQGIIFYNDNQVVEVSYTESPSSQDWYQVKVTELA